MVTKAETKTRPGGDRPDGRADSSAPGRGGVAGHKFDGGGAAPGRIGARGGGDIHAKKVKVVDKSSVGDTKVNQKSGDTTIKDRSRSVNTGDVSAAKTGDNTVPVSAVPGG